MWEDKDKHTQIKDLGEIGLIERLTEKFTIQHESTIKGVGDDAAVIDHKHKKTLVSTEVFLEGIHFDLVYMPLHHLGYKCVVAAISDICAMQGKPSQIFVSLGISNKFTVELIEEIYMGIRIACQNYEIDLAGGDTAPSRQGLVINVTAVGSANKSELTYRNGANVNDLVCVTGDLGGAYLGLNLLEREKKVFIETPGAQPKLEGYDYILQRQLRPEARTDVIKMLGDLKVRPSSMMDVSDGLASEMLHICNASNKGCKIFENKLPIDEKAKKQALEFNLDPTICALNGGEDYELVFTLPQKHYDKIDKNPDISIIGHITEPAENCKLITNSGNEHRLKAQGWEIYEQREQQ